MRQNKYTCISLLLFFWVAITPLYSQWYHLPGPFGGSTRQFDTDGNMLYALTDGGIYKSADAGHTWSILEPTIKIAAQVQEFQVEKGYIFFLLKDGTVQRSNNGGASWASVFQRPYPLPGPGEKPLKLFAAGDTVLIGSVLTTYRSLDRGETWQAADIFFKQRFIGFAKIKNDLYSAEDWLIRKSTDGGLSWQTVYSSGYFFGTITAVDTILYGIYDGFPRLIRSNNGGLSWDKIDFDFESDIKHLTGLGDELYCLTGRECLYGRTLVYYSDDQGDNFSEANQSDANIDWTWDALAFPDRLLAATIQGVFESADKGSSFIPSHRGMNATSVRKVFKTSSGIWWAVTQSGIYSSADDGETWDFRFAYPVDFICWGEYANFIGQTQQRLFMQNCDIAYSADNGSSWDTLSLTTPFYCPQIVTSGQAAFILTEDDLLKLSDGQTEMIRLNKPPVSIWTPLHYDDNTLYLAGNSTIFYSSDEGEHWNEVTSYLKNGKDYGVGGWLDSDAKRIYCIFDDYPNGAFVRAWNKEAQIWEPFYLIDPVSADTISPWDITLFANTGPIRWMGARGRGLYYTAAGDDNWQVYNPGFPAQSPTTLFKADQDFWVGTEGAGIFRTQLEFKTPETPAPHFTLYPNPSTGTSLQLQSDQFFTDKQLLRIFDATGRLVQEQPLPPGQHWTLQLQYLPAGVYILQIQSIGGNSNLKWVKH